MTKKICAVLIALAVVSPAWASPLVYVWMETLGGETSQQVAAGDTVNFVLKAQMAPVGTSNTTVAGGKTITSLVAGADGLKSCRFNIFQSTADPIQVDFSLATLVEPTWTGAQNSPGTLATRGNGYMNLTQLKAVGQVGTAFIGPITLATGSFRVMTAPENTENRIMMSYLASTSFTDVGSFASTSPGTFAINGGSSIIAGATNPDPYFGFTGLNLYTVPEPLSMLLLAVGGLFISRRK